MRETFSWVSGSRSKRLTAAALFTLGLLIGQGREGAAAIAQAQQAVRLDPKNLKLQFNLGLALARAGRPKEAVPHLELAAADTGLSREARYAAGGCYFQLGDFARAVQALEGLAEGTHADHVLYLLEESHRLLGHAKQAGEAFVQLNRRFPDSPWTHYLLGNAYEGQEKLKEALDEYKAAAAGDAAVPNVQFAIGYLSLRQHDLEAARLWFEKQLAVQPCHALASFHLGQLARDDRELPAAVAHFRRSLACDANSAETHLSLGMTLADLNQDQAALTELKRAAELDTANPSPHYRLALLYRKLGRAAESKTEYETVQRLNANRK